MPASAAAAVLPPLPANNRRVAFGMVLDFLEVGHLSGVALPQAGYVALTPPSHNRRRWHTQQP